VQTFDELEEDLRDAPTRLGTVRLIVRRPAVGEREVVTEAQLDAEEGLLGDTWRVRGSSSTADGSPNPEAQITVMGARAAAAFAGDVERWPLAGDQLYVDFDISEANLPAGTRLGLGTAVIEVTAEPHTGCAKFHARFGGDAHRFVNTKMHRQLRLRGLNARVIQPGTVSTGDTIRKL